MEHSEQNSFLNNTASSITQKEPIQFCPGGYLVFPAPDEDAVDLGEVLFELINMLKD